MNNTLKVIFYNVNGILNPIKRSKILSKLRKGEAQIAFLQETHLVDTEHGKLKRGRFKQIFYSSYRSGHRRGAAILISNQIQFEHISEIKDKEGRYVMVIGRIDGVIVTLLCIYAPPGSEWSFYKKIFNMILTESRGVLICGGDMNIRLSKLEHLLTPK